MFLDPGKLLVILIVALVVLGPDKLPGVARQLGAAWGEIRKFRQRLETEVRGTFPDLPSTHQVAQAVRSPLAFLDQLADAHEQEQKDSASPTVPGSIQPSKPAVTSDTDAHDPVSNGSAPDAGHAAGPDVAPGATPGAEPIAAQSQADPPSQPDRVSATLPGASDVSPRRVPPGPRRVGPTRPWRGMQPAEPSVIPDDPSMN